MARRPRQVPLEAEQLRSYFGGWRSPVGEVMPKVGHTGDNEPTHSHEERYGSRTWGDSTHKQACLQAITVATANSTYDWMANKARRTLEDVLDVRAHDRRPKVPPPRWRRRAGRTLE